MLRKPSRVPLTPAALADARERAGLSVAELASLAGCYAEDVENWEAGRDRVPAPASDLVLYAAAVADRSRLLERSGLPECEEARRLSARLEGAGDDHERAADHGRALTAHAATCATCRAREEYLERHAPPVPEFPHTRYARLIGAALHVADRLPAPLRPREGVRGDGRRRALFYASALSMYVAAMLVVFTVVGVLAGTPLGGQWRQLLVILPAIVAAYFVGFYLAGGVFDLTYPMRARFVGYVARGGLGAGLVYGIVALVVPLIDPTASLRDMPVVSLVMAAVGALAGGVLWVKDRISGKLPGAG